MCLPYRQARVTADPIPDGACSAPVCACEPLGFCTHCAITAAGWTAQRGPWIATGWPKSLERDGGGWRKELGSPSKAAAGEGSVQESVRGGQCGPWSREASAREGCDARRRGAGSRDPLALPPIQRPPQRACRECGALPRLYLGGAALWGSLESGAGPSEPRLSRGVHSLGGSQWSANTSPRPSCLERHRVRVPDAWESKATDGSKYAMENGPGANAMGG